MTKYNLIYKNGISKFQHHNLVTINKEFLYHNLNINIETRVLEEAAETMANRNSCQY
jgi:hypothetical protein